MAILKEKKDIKRSEKGRDLEAIHPKRGLIPFEEMDRMFDRWFENFFPRSLLRPFQREWPSWGEMTPAFESRIPKVDVIDRDEDVLVRAELPGVEKDDLDVTVSENSVTIKGETRREKKEEKGDYYRCEISRGSFSRTVALPDYVNTDDTKAKFKDGVLELTLPKVEKTKRRTVKIE